MPPEASTSSCGRGYRLLLASSLQILLEMVKWEDWLARTVVIVK
jgi:hypothetical protein